MRHACTQSRSRNALTAPPMMAFHFLHRPACSRPTTATTTPPCSIAFGGIAPTSPPPMRSCRRNCSRCNSIESLSPFWPNDFSLEMQTTPPLPKKRRMRKMLRPRHPVRRLSPVFWCGGGCCVICFVVCHSYCLFGTVAGQCAKQHSHPGLPLPSAPSLLCDLRFDLLCFREIVSNMFVLISCSLVLQSHNPPRSPNRTYRVCCPSRDCAGVGGM